MQDLTGKVALVTGASRGVGAAVAKGLAQRGADVVLNYRSKGSRAVAVVEAVRQVGREALLVQADITSEADVKQMFAAVQAKFGRLDFLVLNASGGMEKNKAADYAMLLNQISQERLADLAVPLMPSASRIVFVTSHLAHFYGQKPVYEIYRAVAASKHAGEQSLRSRMPILTDKGISLVVVSGDMIEGTITPRLMERMQRGVIAQRRTQAGTLPTVEEFAQAIVDTCADEQLASGDTVYIGCAD